MSDQSKSKVEVLRELREEAKLGGGPERQRRQMEAGKMLARDRIDFLLDDGTFEEFDMFVVHRCTDFGMEKKKILGDGLVSGQGQIDGRRVFIFSQDFTVFGGSMSEMSEQKVCKIMDMAMKAGLPVIGLNDSGGARIQEGILSLAGYADIFLRNTLASGVVPQISVIMGPCAGGAVYSPAITDFVFMVEANSYMFVTGPDVVRAVTHEKVDHKGLGGAQVHATTSGVAHFMAPDDKSCLAMVRKLLTYLPANNMEDPPAIPCTDPVGRCEPALDTLVPENPNKPYDMHDVIEAIVDRESFFEVHEHYAKNIVVGFARLGGRVIGIVGNNPAHLAGALDIDASIKGARFVRFCDCFNIPIITFEDVPGFLPGVRQEHGGIIKHGAKLLYAYCEATVPRITVITRKAYGGAYDVLNSRHIRGDLSLIWPTGQVAVMGADGAVAILYAREIAQADDPDKAKAEKVEEFRGRFANPYMAANLGMVDQVVAASETRPKLIGTLELFENKRDQNPPKKHGNIPL